MVEKIIYAAGILWGPCLFVAVLLSIPFIWEHITTRDQETGSARYFFDFVFFIYWSFVTTVLFLLTMVVGFLLYGGLATIKALWNAA